MIIDKSATSRMNAADRRADDTHWWRAYRLNSTATSTTHPQGPTPSREAVSPYRVFEPAEQSATQSRFEPGDAPEDRLPVP